MPSPTMASNWRVSTSRATVWLAAAAIVGMTLLNAWTVHVGVVTQNVLTAAKVVGLTAVILAGARLAAMSPAAAPATLASPAALADSSSASFGLAMVFVLYAYGGWNDAALVAAEVRNRHRNLPVALVGGVAAIIVIYLAANLAYLTLGFDAARNSRTPAADILQAATGPVGSKLVSGLVMISALGAINGMILSRSRIFAVMGNDHRALRWLGGWHAGHGRLRASLAAQAVVTLAMVLVVGTERGRSAIDAALHAIQAPSVPWEKFSGGFDMLIAATAPVFWTLFFAVGVALIVLRRRDPHLERPFSTPFYPLTPLVFCGTCVFMLIRSAQFAGWLAVAASVPVAAGLVLYLATRSR